jgi:hypothetical protein
MEASPMPGDTKHERWLWKSRAILTAIALLVLAILFLTGHLRTAN